MAKPRAFASLPRRRISGVRPPPVHRRRVIARCRSCCHCRRSRRI